jgi:hypothetical protein
MQLTIAQAQAIIASPVFAMRGLPASTSYKFARLMKVIQSELQTYDSERMKLIEDCKGVLNEESNTYKFTKENEKRFGASIAPLLEETFDIGGNFPMELPHLDLSPAELLQLDPLFDIPEPSASPATDGARNPSTPTPLKRRK